MSDIGKIGVVGAGPGGLALAHGLLKNGFDVCVYERDRSRRDYVQGFRLRVPTRGLQALERLLPPSLYQAILETAGRAPSATRVYDEILHERPGEGEPDKSDDAHIEKSVSRITLRQALLSGLDGVIAFGKVYESFVENTDGTVTARFQHGTAETVDPDAFTRHGLIGRNDPGHTGLGGLHFDNTASYIWWNIAFWQDEIAGDHPLEVASGETLLDLLGAYAGHWHPEIRKVLQITDPATVAVLKVRTSEQIGPWAPRRVTLLGDALHAMTYFRALGANSAIYDAGLLVDALLSARSGAPIAAALAAYEQGMRDHGFGAVTESIDAMQRSLGQRHPHAA